MECFNLVNSVADHKQTFRVSNLKPCELCYIRINSLDKISETELNLIIGAARRTNSTFLSFPIDEISSPDLLKIALGTGVRGFVLRCTINNTKFSLHAGKGSSTSGDFELFEKIKKIQSSLPENIEIAIEFIIEEDLRLLAPTIASIHEIGVKWMVFDQLGNPDKIKTQAFRAVFEYLRIRSCNYLNLYFSFWNQSSEEWNIKTQNTFSGLSQVHIDLSNRCTHNCIFCGLYGPDAIEDMKKNGGGTIQKNVSDFMKMEIDSEQCLKIINSLPWTVKNIQFGGAGDPLMHTDAVKFIAAARSRGFSVEILSNMEYLEEADIKLLHDLADNQLSFYANISGGTPEMYTKTRPKQGLSIFNKIVKNLELFSSLKNQDKRGACITIMCVVNQVNIDGLLDLAKLAVQVKAEKLWFKPMEVHTHFQHKLVPNNEMMKNLARSLAEAVKYAESNGIVIMQREYCEKIINLFSDGVVHV